MVFKSFADKRVYLIMSVWRSQTSPTLKLHSHCAVRTCT